MGAIAFISLFLTACSVPAEQQEGNVYRNPVCESPRLPDPSLIRADGAFYLFMKTPEPDATAFCRRAMKENLLVVPGDSFGTPGYVRLAYCVSRDTIERSLPTFRRLAEEYDITK